MARRSAGRSTRLSNCLEVTNSLSFGVICASLAENMRSGAPERSIPLFVSASRAGAGAGSGRVAAGCGAGGGSGAASRGCACARVAAGGASTGS